MLSDILASISTNFIIRLKQVYRELKLLTTVTIFFVLLIKTIFFMENTQQPQEKVSLWQKVKIVLATVLAIFILILIIQNWNDISISLVFKTVSTPLPVIIVISLITGYIWGTVSAYQKSRRKNRTNNSL